MKSRTYGQASRAGSTTPEFCEDVTAAAISAVIALPCTREWRLRVFEGLYLKHE
jgi:hypothetical protein